MQSRLIVILAAAVWSAFASAAYSQKLPEVGYVFPPGGKAGTTVDVRLGGYDWTPDMEFFVHDKRVQLTSDGTLGPILIPGPPYWFGAKGRIVANPLPREISAKFVIPADMPPGPIYWQAANANGCTSTGVFVVGAGNEIVGDDTSTGPQVLTALPCTVSGRLAKIEEVDRYRFVAAKDGPITCELTARRLGAKFLGILEVRDKLGQFVCDAAGSNGSDPALTFAAKAGVEYTVSVSDIDFGGDRSYVYRLTVAPGPRVVGAIPAVGQRGETREVEFVGYGIATGTAKLESVKRSVRFPTTGAVMRHRLETPFGAAPDFEFPLSDLPEVVAGPSKSTGAASITGVLDQPDADARHVFDWKKGETWSLELQARRIGSPLDPALAIVGPDGKELARNDDLPETTDAGLEFTVPADGEYQVVVSDTAGKSGNRAAIYHLVVQPAKPDFSLSLTTQRLGVPADGRANLTVKALRKGGFKGPIMVSVDGLLPGIGVHPALVIPADKAELTFPLHAHRLTPITASFVSVEGAGGGIRRTALAPAAGNLAPRCPDESRTSQILVAATLAPRFKGRPVDQDTVRKVHRGTTFPAEVLIERMDDFAGEIILQMAAQQSYQVQGITGGEVIVPPGVERAVYPCHMPEWLETSRTSRMGMIAVAKVADRQGKTRWLTGEVAGFVTMVMEGALLKIAAEEQERIVSPGQPFEVQLKVSRSAKLTETVHLELRAPEELASLLKAEPIILAPGQNSVVFRLHPAAELRGSQTFKIRASALQEGKYPVIAEASVTIEFPQAIGNSR